MAVEATQAAVSNAHFIPAKARYLAKPPTAVYATLVSTHHHFSTILHLRPKRQQPTGPPAAPKPVSGVRNSSSGLV